MQTILSWFRLRPLRMFGGLLVFLSLGLLVFLVLQDFMVGMANPYMGIVTYMLVPGVLLLGLILVPIDLWIQKRRARSGRPQILVLDWNNPVQRKIASFFGITTVFVLIALTVVSYKGVEYMDTKDFCGRVCHKVMMPEYTAYTYSAHASVTCIQCHIGPGASWFVRSKLSGVPQVWHYTKGDYPRPLETPVAALRPSRDTCENCHTPTRFYGSRLRTTISYGQDQANTRTVQSMLMHVGSGGALGSGIHSHMVSQIDYLPGTKDHREIAWVQVTRPDGSKQEFVNPAYQGKLAQVQKQFSTRRMDCIDCHNRAAHDFVPYEQMIDSAMTRRDIDPSVPFIKKQAMEVGVDEEKKPTEANHREVLAKIDLIPAFYEKSMPEVFKARAADINRSVKAIRQVFLDSAFPHMLVNTKTYTNWRSHDGCFRCHDTMQATKPDGKRPNIPGDCNLCHTEQRPGEPK